MAFKKIEGLPGLIYVPDDDKPKKHPCPDCFSCQFCDDARCALCLKYRKCRKRESSPSCEKGDND